ncbi:MAG: SIMPL domain-containing protein [Acidimicrobiales bacterium]
MLVGLALVGSAGLGLAACGAPGGQPAKAVSVRTAAAVHDPKCAAGQPTVTVGGHGVAQGAPDELTISLGVQTQAPTALTSMTANATKAHAVLAKLQSDGVGKADLQTSGLSVQPVYTGPNSKLTGYQVTNSLTVTLKTQGEMARAGTFIDDAAQVSGNAVRVNDINFSVQDVTALMSEARSQAVRQAAGQAQAMASAAGMTLGTLCSLHDNSQPATPPQPFYGLSARAAAQAMAPPTPIEAGSEQVTADVTAIYQLVAG